MKNYLYVFALLAILTGCQTKTEVKEQEDPEAIALEDTIAAVNDISDLTIEDVAVAVEDVDEMSGESDVFNTSAALSFINGYVADQAKLQGLGDIENWITSSPYVTAAYRAAVKKEIRSIIEHSEAVMDADIIFGTQDYPDEGFELESVDEKTGYVVVKGKKWTAFKLTMKLAKDNGRWLVDGCGDINIPANKKSK